MTQPAAPAQQPQPLPPAPEGFMNIFVDGQLVHLRKGGTVMEACTLARKEIPHFCYHERLSIPANCRMCLVEVEGMPKPVASCHWPASEGMKVRTSSPLTTEARKGTMEMLLINHPLDCPICDQGGECTLQDQAVAYGSDRTRYNEFKRAVDDKDIGSKIKTVMTRCIHCTRCVRFATEIAGVEEFGATGRGENMQIGTYVEQALQSELAGNMIDLCPVGALTSRPYAYTARPWELNRTASVDILDAIAAPISVDTRAGQVMRVLPRDADELNDQLHEEWITDATRFSYDALHTNRLTAPRLKKGKVQYTVGWPEVFPALKDRLKKADAKSIAGLMGDLQCAEDAHAFKAFITQTLGSSNLDGRTDGSTLGTAGRGEYVLNTAIADFDKADAVLLVGCNPRTEAPLLNVRLRRGVLKRRLQVASVGPVVDLTYAHQHLSEAAESLAKLATGRHAFSETLRNAASPVILVSASVYTRPDAAAIAGQLAALARKVGATVSVLQPTAGRVTALDMGVLPGQGGKGTAAILKAWKSGAISTLFVYGDGSLQPEQFTAGLEAGGTLVYLGTHLSPIAKLAHIVLPTAAWSEKGGLYANAEGRVQEAHAATRPPLHAKEDWKIFRALSAEVAGQPLPFDTLEQLRSLIAAVQPAYAPENIGVLLPLPAPAAGKMDAPDAGQPSDAPLAAPVSQYYLRTAYHRESPTMHACQAEQGLAQIKVGLPHLEGAAGNIAHKPPVKSPPRKATFGTEAA